MLQIMKEEKRDAPMVTRKQIAQLKRRLSAGRGKSLQPIDTTRDCPECRNEYGS